MSKNQPQPIRFPNPRNAQADGLVYIGGDPTPDNLLSAYRLGIFPWPLNDFPALTWFCPAQRGILFLKDYRRGRTLRRLLRQTKFSFSFNQDFAGVLQGCAEAKRRILRDEPPGTWLTPAMLSGYQAFHERGFAHSVETWSGDRLIGGLYLVEVDGVISAESMFFREPNASRLALTHLVDYLSGQGVPWIDFQVLNDFTKTLGATEIPQSNYLDLLKKAQKTSRSPIF